MPVKLNMILFVAMTVICVASADGRLEGDVQTEIQMIKDELVGIKDTEKMTAVTMMGFSQMMKIVDSRVTDVAKESTEMVVSLLRLSEKEERHHDEVILHKEKIQNIEQQSAILTGKVDQLSTSETKSKDEIEQLQHQSSLMSKKIETLAEKDAMENLSKSVDTLTNKEEGLKNITEAIKSQTDHTDQKVRSLAQSMDSLRKKEEVLKNVTETIKSQTDHTDQKVQSLTQSLEILSGKVEELKERGMVDALHPIGSIYITFSNVEPPKNGQYGVAWEKLPEGYVLMTANNGNVGTTNGGQRLDSGNTEGHQLTVAQMPSHSHQYSRYDHEEPQGYSGGNSVPWTAHGGHTTSSTGGDQAHSHNLNIFNHKVLVWRRTA